MEKKKYRKTINFDLSSNELMKIYPDTSIPYSAIKRFMLKNGFEHRQKSGYVSIEPMSDIDITKFSEKLGRKFTWLEKCLDKYDIANIGDDFDLRNIVIKVCKEQEKKKDLKKEKSKEKGLER